MVCRTIALPGGGIAIVCGPRPRRRAPLRCCVCNVSEPLATMKLCDGPAIRGPGTCDAPVCVEHACHVEPDSDYCPRHVPKETV